MTSRAELETYLTAHQTGTLSDRETYHSIHEFGRENFMPAQAVVEEYLHHADPQFRYVALDVVGNHWHLAEHWDTAYSFLMQDIDSDCRRMGASVLGGMMRDTQDVKTLRILASTVANTAEDKYVRQTAYRSMREILNYSPQEAWSIGKTGYDLQCDADWEWIASFLS